MIKEHKEEFFRKLKEVENFIEQTQFQRLSKDQFKKILFRDDFNFYF